MKVVPSKYQMAINDMFVNTNCNLIVSSCAGSGKTTTIVNLCDKIPYGKYAIFVAFSRAIAAELRTRIPERIAVKTLHANGLNELRFKYFRQPGVTNDNFLDEGKIGRIIMSLIDKWEPWEDNDEGQADRASYASRVEKIVDIMRFSLATDRDEIATLCYKHGIELTNGEIANAMEVLKASNDTTKVFDFVDMIYRPAIGNWRLKQFDYVIVDECQDMNKAQQEMVRKMLKPDGRLIAIGDPMQSIFGFCGADIESFDVLGKMLKNTVVMPLSVCYRCGSDIIDHAKELVPHIEARPGADKGEVRIGHVAEIRAGDLVLCRNTRPLVGMCMKFIIDGKKATIKGADIGKNLAMMIRNTKRKTLDAAFNKLDKEYTKLVDKATKQFPTRKSEEVSYCATYNDKVEALRTIAKAKDCRTPDQLCREIEDIFVENTQGIVLSTMHKSKGLEAERVFIIERFRLPAKFAKQDWEHAQETNLDYVARTRAKKLLAYVDDFLSEPEKKKEHESALSRFMKK